MAKVALGVHFQRHEPTTDPKADCVELVVALNNAMEQWSYSYCDRSYFYCDVVKAGALTIARGDQ